MAVRDLQNNLSHFLRASGFVWSRIAIPAVISIVLTMILWRFDQFHEIYAAMAIDVLSSARSPESNFLLPIVRVVLSAVGLYFACRQLWYFSRLNLLDDGPDERLKTEDPEGEEGWGSRFGKAVELWLPRLVGLLPALGLIGGSMRAVHYKTLTLDYFAPNETISIAIRDEVLVLSALGIAAAGILFATLLRQVLRHKGDVRFLTLRTTAIFVAGLALAGLLPWLAHLPSAAEDYTRDQALVVANALLVGGIGGLIISFLWAVPGATGSTFGWHVGVLLSVGGMVTSLYPTATDAVVSLSAAIRRFDEARGGWIPEVTLSAVALLVLIVLATRAAFNAVRVAVRNRDLWDRERSRLTKLGLCYAACFLGMVVFFYGLDHEIAAKTGWPMPSQIAGPIALLGLFAALFTGLAALLSALSRAWGLPVFGAIVAVSVIVSGFDWNEHHLVRSVALGEATVPEEQASVKAGFRAWWTAERSADCNGTVVIATAQGGGHYAAYHAASTLAQIEDTSRAAGIRFSRCLFAMSTISGGSVGAGVFAAALELLEGCKGTPADPEICRDPMRTVSAVNWVLRQDILSPLGGRLFFTDLAADVPPLGLIGNGLLGRFSSIDRSAAMEDTLWIGLDAWRDAAFGAGDGPLLFDSGIATSWRPERDIPALVLNTADVSTGQRLVLSPFREIRIGERPATTGMLAHSCDQGGNGRLLVSPTVQAAMVLSARFPAVMPPGRIPGAEGAGCPSPHVIDGGAFENSGIETARDVIDAILAPPKAWQKGHPEPTRIGMLVIGFEDGDAPTPLGDGALPMGEVLSPVQAFFFSWRARTVRSKELAMDRFRWTAGAAPYPPVSLHLARLESSEDNGYPLSWMLSARNFNRMCRDAGVISGMAQGLPDEERHALEKRLERLCRPPPDPSTLCHENAKDIAALAANLGILTEKDKPSPTSICQVQSKD
ncbi:MAG: hypothetical protein AAF183_23630 [Pseudomonadota bacterium]